MFPTSRRLRRVHPARQVTPERAGDACRKGHWMPADCFPGRSRQISAVYGPRQIPEHAVAAGGEELLRVDAIRSIRLPREQVASHDSRNPPRSRTVVRRDNAIQFEGSVEELI